MQTAPTGIPALTSLFRMPARRRRGLRHRLRAGWLHGVDLA